MYHGGFLFCGDRSFVKPFGDGWGVRLEHISYFVERHSRPGEDMSGFYFGVYCAFFSSFSPAFSSAFFLAFSSAFSPGFFSKLLAEFSKQFLKQFLNFFAHAVNPFLSFFKFAHAGGQKKPRAAPARGSRMYYGGFLFCGDRSFVKPFGDG